MFEDVAVRAKRPVIVAELSASDVAIKANAPKRWASRSVAGSCRS
jgi:hypothetical protein